MAIMQSFGKDGEIDKDKLIENLQDVDGIDPSTIPSDSDFDFPLTIVVDDYEVVIEENGDVHIEGEEGGNTNTMPGGNTNTNPGGNTNTGGDNETGGGNTSGEDNEVGGNNGTGDTNATNEIEIPDAETSGVIEVSGPTWSNGTASITISKGSGVDNSLKMQYKKSTESDDKYVTVNGNSETISGLNDGEVIIVRLTDGKGNYGGIKTINIEDANKPTVVVNQGTVTETSIQITVNATDSESGIPSPASYRYYIKKNTDADYPTQPEATDGNAGYTFNGLDDNTSYDIKVEVVDRAGNTGSGELNGVKTLVTVPDGNVSGAIKVEGPTWTNGKASINVSIGDDVDDSLYLEYKKGETGEYIRLEGDTIGDLVSGDTIYIHLTDGTRDGTDKIITISDTTGPTVSVTQGTVTTNSITVNVNANDAESGMPAQPTYEYYIKESTEQDYPSTPDGGPSTEASHTFIGLKQNISYDIQVKTSDIAGKEGAGTITIKTGTVPDAGDGQTGSIVWGNVNWDPSQGTASITVSKGAGVDESLQIQYQVVANGETQPVENSYQIIANGGTISNLGHGNVVYARLWDGTNGGKTASINIQDNVKPSATIQFTETTADVDAQITATVTQTDNESGVASGKYIFNANSGNIGEEEANYTGTISGNTVTISASVEGTYYLHVLTIDRAGNKKETVSEAVTIEVSGSSADDIAQNLNEYLGEYVDYHPKNGANVKWKIFYAGTNPNVSGDTTNRIYLIADDYINVSYAPKGKKGTPIDATSTYQANLTYIVKNEDYYNGLADITNNLVKQWLSYLYKDLYSYNINMQATAYLLDTNAWSNFLDTEGKAEYAIGGPTLDLFCASYNKKYPNNQILYQTDMDGEGYGYVVKLSSDYDYGYEITGLPTDDSLYVISSRSKAYEMWLASPSAYYMGHEADELMNVNFRGDMVGGMCFSDESGGSSPGLRPIVCLKADTKLVKQSDGTTYRIK